MRTKLGAFSLVVVLCLSGIWFAVASSLPGDRAYIVKVGVYEQIVGSFAVGSAPHMQLTAERAEKRVEEAEALAATQRLTSEAVSQLSGLFQTSIASMLAQIQERTSDSPESTATLSSQTQAVLAAHISVLRALTSDAPSFIEVLQKAQNDLALASHNAMQSIVSGRAMPETKVFAERAIAEAQERVEATSVLLKASSKNNDRALAFSVAVDALTSAERAFDEAAYGPAFELALRAWRQASTVLILERASLRYGMEISV